MKYCDDNDFSCEVYYWVNLKANPYTFVPGVMESYTKAEVKEVLNNYHLGVEKNEIPEWVEPRNSQTEYKIIQYLIKKNRAIKKSVEGRIRAIFQQLINSVVQKSSSEEGRELINPCYLYPKTEKCDGSTELSKIFNEQNGKGDDKPSALFEWNNLFQTITILSVAGLATYAGVKYVSSKDYKTKRLNK